MVGKNTERMILAALLSFTVYGATWYWYRITAVQVDSNANAKPVAYVGSVREDVQRRPVELLVWQLLNDGEPLYPGEVIRTNANSEVRIQFAESSRFIDLEPDTEIVLSQSSDEVSLELTKGNLFVAQGDKDDGGKTLTLNSGNGKVDLSSATASLSKSDGANLNVQVLKGKAKIEANGQSKELDSGKSGGVNANGSVFDQAAIQILSPSLDKVSYVNPDNITPTPFSWTGLPDKALVQLMVGPNRKNLKMVGTTSAASPTSISHTVKPGKYFWKLVAKNPTDQTNLGESPTYRLEVASRFAPTPHTPESDAYIQLAKPDQAVIFSWFKPEDTLSVYLEVAKKPDFKEKVISKNITEKNDQSEILPAGEYYWRLSGTYEGLQKPVVGKPSKFVVSNKPKVEKPPVIIGWLTPDANNTVHYIEKPSVAISWKAEQEEQVKRWKVRIAEQEVGTRGPAADTMKTFESKDMNQKISLEKGGKYWTVIEAYDDTGHLLAKSEPKIIDVVLQPLLSAPEFQPSTGDLKADNQGKISLTWNKVEGAKEYAVSFLDKDGKKLREARFQTNSTSLVNLLPGRYQVEITAVDQNGRVGQRAPARALVVPETSGLQAPKLKKIKVN